MSKGNSVKKHWDWWLSSR